MVLYCKARLAQGRTVVGGIVSIKILLMRGADGGADIYR